MKRSQKVNSGYDLSFNRTDEIIDAANKGKLPNQIMFTFHPQRWTDNKTLWYKELVVQNLKNQVVNQDIQTPCG